MKFLFLANYASALFMTGLIWCIQVVHYPLFEKVGKEMFSEYHNLHSMRITYIVLPVMLAEILTGFLLLGDTEYLSPILSMTLFGMILGIWASTFFLQVPYHGKLSGGMNPEDIHALVNTNWIRTILWTLRSAILSYILLRRLA